LFRRSFSGNVRQVASSGRSCRPAVKVTCFNKLPLQSLPVRVPTYSSVLILLLDVRYLLLDIGYFIRIFHRALPYAITCQAFSLVKMQILMFHFLNFLILLFPARLLNSGGLIGYFLFSDFLKNISSYLQHFPKPVCQTFRMSNFKNKYYE
jgi:hypothetical protein